MNEFLDQYGYLALSLGTFFEGETALLVASSLVHKGLFEGPYTLLFGFLGSFVSDWFYYLIGRLNGKHFIDHRPRLKARVQPVRSFFARHQLQILFSYRFLYGFRILIPLIIGMSHVTPLRYLGYSICTGLLWALTVGTLGYLIGGFFDLTIELIEEHFLFLVGGFALFGMILGYTIKFIFEQRMAKETQ